MPRVLQIGKYYPPVRGGMETHLESLCQGLRRKVDLEVIVSHAESETRTEEIGGVRVKRLGAMAKVLGSPLCRGLRRAIGRSQADIVHIHLPNPLALAAYLLSGTKAKLVVTYHSDIVRQRVSGALISPMQERALRAAAALIVSSPNLLEGSKVLRRHQNRVHVVPFGYSPPSRAELARDAVSGERLREQFAKPLILAVGRMVYYKGFEVLLEALAQVPEATLVLVGDGPLRASLEEKASLLGLDDRVCFTGNVESTGPYYRACDIFVLPAIARSEAFGLVQLEAMARGKPVINTSVASGVPYVSLHGQTGLTVEPGDAEALAGAIRRLANDAELRGRLGGAGRERLATHFTVAQMVEQTMQVYHSVLETESMPLLAPASALASHHREIAHSGSC